MHFLSVLCTSQTASLFAAVDTGPILEQFGNLIYLAMAVCAGYGLYCIIVLMRRVKEKSFPGREAASAFLDDVSELLEKNDFEGAVEVCDTPELWSRAVPQLVQVGVENRAKPIRKIKQIVGDFFSREILAEFDVRTSWVNTIVKSAPMLGLLGTVTGMIQAFKKIAGTGESGVKPSELAADISFALFTTAGGLAIAIPLVVLGAMTQTRISKLQDSVQDNLGTFFDDLEAAQVRGEDSPS
ncbi:MAG: MotA/TolQ/ExbB proton channel family protein [Fuerstiella sp.]|nr:MotA/TolQ/ExbB proton channel family protein [Fuerstiella sp.]MCP4857263.1 MotA/TolQ/ExbB proton channel family protein [Fuerstiella sp.]